MCRQLYDAFTFSLSLSPFVYVIFVMMMLMEQYARVYDAINAGVHVRCAGRVCGQDDGRGVRSFPFVLWLIADVVASA